MPGTKEQKFNIIEIVWDGPFTIQEVLENKNDISGCKGLYQIYGNHEVNGNNNLLYLGKSTTSVCSRLKDHDKYWIPYETTPVQIFIGKFQWEGTNQITEDKLNHKIDIAERLLTFLCQPPYSSSLKTTYKEDFKGEYDIVINYGRKQRLPTEVSTYWYNNNNAWKEVERIHNNKK